VNCGIFALEWELNEVIVTGHSDDRALQHLASLGDAADHIRNRTVKKITSANEVHMSCSGTHRTFWSVAVAVSAAVALTRFRPERKWLKRRWQSPWPRPLPSRRPRAKRGSASAVHRDRHGDAGCRNFARQALLHRIPRAQRAELRPHLRDPWRLARRTDSDKTVSGLHPASESRPWMIGHFILVPSETGPATATRKINMSSPLPR